MFDIDGLILMLESKFRDEKGGGGVSSEWFEAYALLRLAWVAEKILENKGE